MANTRIGRTVSVAGSRQKATFSAWIKRTGLGESWIAKFGGNYSQGNYMQIGFDDTDGCFIIGDTPSSTPRMQSTRKFRDTNAWYNYVVAFDTTQNTASDRLKFYINGELITAYGTATYPTLNQNLNFNMTGSYNNAWLGGRGESTYEFNGLMSHVNWIDGTAYDASAFGSTDSVTGEWKINTAPSVTYGTNGYFMLKDGNSLTDASGKGNNFTLLTGTLTDTKDNPSNVLNVLNPLSAPGSSLTFGKGNTEINFDASSTWHAVYSTIGATSGKYYAECLIDAVGGETSIGIIPTDTVNNVQLTGAGDYMGKEANSIGYVNNGQLYKTNSVQETTSTYTTADIISFTFDLDNNTIQFYKNNSSAGSAISLPSNTTYMIGSSGYNGSRQRWNFGNGYFGTSTVSSAGTNASGNGIFEYNVPTGYTALSTKGLNL